MFYVIEILFFLEKGRKRLLYLAGWESTGEITVCARNADCRSGSFQCFLQYWKMTIIEWFELQGALEIISFQHPCDGQRHLPLD